LGGGSNSLISSNGVKGAVISTASMNWVERVSGNLVLIGSGAKMPKLAGQLSYMGLSGCEFMEGIPGTVGGAIIMNAGAHGQWTSGVLEKVTFLDTFTCEEIIMHSSELEFGYRRSTIDSKRYIIMEALFKLNEDKTEYISERMKQYSRQRNMSQPKGFSSGCIFRNPSPNLPAGKLIDEMGFKGEICGGAEISSIHANFIMNAHGASSEDICYLINKIQTKAWTTRGTWLEPEVCGMGQFSEEQKMLWIHPNKRNSGNLIVPAEKEILVNELSKAS
jgi:UDP-N-acetylenolpyruvoylglucosamine reductase